MCSMVGILPRLCLEDLSRVKTTVNKSGFSFRHPVAMRERQKRPGGALRHPRQRRALHPEPAALRCPHKTLQLNVSSMAVRQTRLVCNEGEAALALARWSSEEPLDGGRKGPMRGMLITDVRSKYAHEATDVG